MIEISKRKMESYKRAEIVAREAHHQVSVHHRGDPSRLEKALARWMAVTGNIKWSVPKDKGSDGG